MAEFISASEKLKRTSVVFVVSALIGGLAGIQPIYAASERLTVDVGACVDLKSSQARLACYQKQVDAAVKQRGEAPASSEVSRRNAPPATSDSDRGAAQAAGAAELRATGAPSADANSESAAKSVQVKVAFGASASASDDREATGARHAAHSSAGAGSSNGSADPHEFFAIVEALRETVPNSYLITLKNGQVWRQTYPEVYHLQPGYKVRIYPTHWGDAYRMSAEKLHGFIQVERVR